MYFILFHFITLRAYGKIYQLVSMGKDGKHFHVAYEKSREADRALEAHSVRVTGSSIVEIQVRKKKKKDTKSQKKFTPNCIQTKIKSIIELFATNEQQKLRNLKKEIMLKNDGGRMF
jgi:hypothetical protein